MTGERGASTQSPRTGSHWASCRWFWAWAVVGAVAAFGLVAVGVLALGPALIVGAALSSSEAARRSTLGLLAGAGLVSLYIAYVQRQGPGTTCWHTATATGCDQHLNPIPWLVIGLALFVGAVLVHGFRRTASPDSA